MAKLENHLFVSIDNQVGKLAEVTGRIKDAGINITSMITFGEGAQGNMVLGTSDNAGAREAIAGSVRMVHEMAILVVTLQNEPGAFHDLCAKIAGAGITIDWACATTTGGEAAVMLTTSDNARASELV